ncbi:hypothetical protein [Bacillus sp. B15-48]|uniref:hypothetical protein n=1 Tax=Bacillus sp. B15-48 TaxID=1548601 RepID=UPI00193FA96E|nr:hypothetical protein [Bacillus sp. B15-48]
MELTLNKAETAVLILHMSIMRSSVKKGFKKTYEKAQAKELLKSFDDVLNMFKSAEIIENEHLDQETTFIFTSKELDILLSFVSWYKKELETMFSDVGESTQENKEQLKTLGEIKRKLELLEVIEHV